MDWRQRLRRLERGSWLEARWQRDATPSLDPRALAVWERMSSEHRDWARRAAAQGVVAAHPHHARILADLGEQYRRHRARLSAWIVTPLLLLALAQLGTVIADPRALGGWLAVAAPALGAVTLLLADRATRRAVRANERRAGELTSPAPAEPLG